MIDQFLTAFTIGVVIGVTITVAFYTWMPALLSMFGHKKVSTDSSIQYRTPCPDCETEDGFDASDDSSWR